MANTKIIARRTGWSMARTAPSRLPAIVAGMLLWHPSAVGSAETAAVVPPLSSRARSKATTRRQSAPAWTQPRTTSRLVVGGTRAHQDEESRASILGTRDLVLQSKINCCRALLASQDSNMGTEGLADPDAPRGAAQKTTTTRWRRQPTEAGSGSTRADWGPPVAPALAPPPPRPRPRRTSRRCVAGQLVLWAATGGAWTAMTTAVGSPVAQRQLLSASAAEPVRLSSSSSSSSSSGREKEDADKLLPCTKGGLAPERPIPGAYQNACMELEMRRVPVVVDKDDAVVWLTVEQRPSQVGAGATGKAVWNSGILLSRLLQRLAAITATAASAKDGPATTAGWFRGKSVMELGCGVGLGSLTCALLGANIVHATDGNAEVVALAARNVATNRLESNVTASLLPWGTLPAVDYSEQVDLVIGSDLTYSPGSWRALAETMETVLTPDGYVLYVSLGHAGFPVNAEVDGFVMVARDMGLVSVASPHDPLWPFHLSSSTNPTDAMSGRSLSDLLVQECLFDARERDIVESAGGVRVVLLTHKRRTKY